MLPLDRRRAGEKLVADAMALWRVRIEHRDTMPYETLRAEKLASEAVAAAEHEFLLRTNANPRRLTSVVAETTAEGR